MVPTYKRKDCPDFIEAKQPLAGGKFLTAPRAAVVSPKVLWRPVLQLPLAGTEPPHQVHLRHVQKVSRLLPCLRTRPQGNTR